VDFRIARAKANRCENSKQLESNDVI
jgi:hypothetical protein